MNDPMMGGSGFGAGEGLDFLEGFGMEEIPEVPGVVDLDSVPKLDPLDDTMISKDNLEIEQIGPIDGIEEISAIPVQNQLVDDDSDEEDSQPLDIMPHLGKSPRNIKQQYMSTISHFALLILLFTDSFIC